MAISVLIGMAIMFACGYIVRPYVDDVREIFEVEKALKKYVNENRGDNHD